MYAVFNIAYTKYKCWSGHIEHRGTPVRNETRLIRMPGTSEKEVWNK
jgi:hypothetical protein